MQVQSAFIVPGETCWRVEQADRLSVIFDGAAYFRVAKSAMLSARRAIMLIGWDFDTRIEFEPDEVTLEGPNTLGDFLAWLPKERPDLEVYMLKWDLGAVQSLQRGMWPMALRPAWHSKNFHFKLDSSHPSGGAHHSKIVVIDDRIAFCGGIDMTAGRWDNPEHLDAQPHRHMPGHKEPSKPWHDATTAVAGPLAAALGDLARQRWFRATGETLEPPKDCPPIWPDLEPTFEGVPVGLARTYPDFEDFPETREIEAFYLKAIREARQTFYVETQYFASARIARAIAERLAEPEGPEFVVVLPEKAEGWLRQRAMDGARERLLKFLWANDPHDRFAAYYPTTAGGAAIYVHAKLLIVDDQVLRIGSSNLNNRSMGFDTECDLVVDAATCEDPEQVRQTITSLREDLLSEHLEVAPDVLERVRSETGSLIETIKQLRGEGRTLRPFTREDLSEDASILAENELADPEGVEGGLIDRMTEGVRGLFGAGNG